MPSYTKTSRSINCVQTNPRTEDCVIYVRPPAGVVAKRQKQSESSLDSDPFFNSAKSFPSGYVGISFDPINKIQVLYPESLLGENTSLPIKTAESLVEDSTVDSDNSLESDDSDTEGRQKKNSENLSMNEQILKTLKSLRNNTLEYQRQSLDYIDTIYESRRRSSEREEREIQLLEAVIANLHK